MTRDASSLDQIFALGVSPWRRWLSLPIATTAWGAALLIAFQAQRREARVHPDAEVGLSVVLVDAVPPVEPPREAAPAFENAPSPARAPSPAPPESASAPASTPIAAAAAVETAPDDDNPYTDDDTMVVGHADTFAGGVSGANGAAGGGAGTGYGSNGGAKAAPPPDPDPEPDRSRPARCRLDVDWGCKPHNAHDAALTVVRLLIRASGAVEDVDVVTAPDGAFRTEAIACSRRQTCEAARDPHGRSLPGWTHPIRIRFTY